MAAVVDAMTAHVVAPRLAEFTYAAGEALSADPVSALLTMGPAGILALLLLTRRLVTSAELDRVIKERDQRDAELSALRKKFEDDVVPALTRLADATLAQQRGGASP